MLIIKKSSPKQKKKKKKSALSNDDFDGYKRYIRPSRICRREICGGAIFVGRAPISYYAHVTLAHVNRKLRKIVSEDDLHNQRKKERASASSWRCSSAPLCPFVEGNGERVVKKGSTVTTSFARQNSRGPCLGYDMKAVRKKEGEREGDQNRRNKFE